MLDLRYQRSPDSVADGAGKSMMGTTQKQWLKDSLEASTAVWKIIMSSVSANIHARQCNFDHWIGFKTEAEEMKNFIAGFPHLVDSTIMVSGDLHSGGGIGKYEIDDDRL